MSRNKNKSLVQAPCCGTLHHVVFRLLKTYFICAREYPWNLPVPFSSGYISAFTFTQARSNLLADDSNRIDQRRMRLTQSIAPYQLCKSSFGYAYDTIFTDPNNPLKIIPNTIYLKNWLYFPHQ